MLTVQETAERLDVSLEMVRKWIHRGTLRAKKMGNRYLIYDKDVIKLKAARNSEVGLRGAAEMMGLSEYIVRQGLEEGWIPGKRINGRYKFKKVELMALMEAMKWTKHKGSK